MEENKLLGDFMSLLWIILIILLVFALVGGFAVNHLLFLIVIIVLIVALFGGGRL